MALFGRKKKKEEDVMPDIHHAAPSSVPIDHVAGMMQQGYSNEQIMQALQSQGYSSSQIYDAINQAAMRPMQDYQSQQTPSYYQQYPQAPQQPAQQPAQPQQSIDEDKIQEIAEAVIEEKWEEIAKDIKAVVEWKTKTETKIAQLEQSISDLRSSVENLNAGILGKISQYDKNLTEVGTEIKAMEKVFQNILPTLTDNVAKLERIAKGEKLVLKK